MRLKPHILVSFFLALTIIILATLYSEKSEEVYTPVPFLQSKQRWADSLLRKFDRTDKVGQLMMVIAEPDSSEQENVLTGYIKKYKPGGIAFRGYDVNSQWQRTKIYQSASENPLLIGMYASTGSNEFLQVPNDFSLAAINNDSLINDLGIALGQQSLALGVNLYFLPTSYEEQSPENRSQITDKVMTISQRLQEQRVLAVPVDVHSYFPYEKDSTRLDSLLTPYQQYSKMGTSGFLLGNKIVNGIKLNSSKQLIVRKYLEGQINYKGLLIGEIDNNGEEVEEQVKKMMKAGVDLIVLNKNHIAKTASTIHNLMNRKDLSGPELNEKAKRVLLAKSWSRTRTTSAEARRKDTFEIDHHRHRIINRNLKKESITLLNNQADHIPFQDLEKKRFHVLTIGEKSGDLVNQMRFYTEISNSHLERKDSDALPALNVRFLSRFKPVVLVFNNEMPDSVRDKTFFESLKKLKTKTEVVAINMGDVNQLKELPDLAALVQIYGNSSDHQKLVAQALFGGVTIKGMLPKSLNQNLTYGQGYFAPNNRLTYTFPEEIGLSSNDLTHIDSVVYEGISEFAMPGCQVLVAKAGNVIYHKAFGYHTYAKKRPVNLTDLYDIASVTKVAGTTVAAMKMYDQKRMSPEERLGQFFKDQYVFLDSVISKDTVWVFPDTTEVEPEAGDSLFTPPVILVSQREIKGLEVDTFSFGDTLMIVSTQRSKRTKVKSEIFKLKIADLLTHHSGLPAGLPIRPYIKYRNKRVGRYGKYYKSKKDSLHSVQVAAGYYLRRDYLDSLWKETKKIVPDAVKNYSYSDANLVLVQMAIDSVNKEPISHYLNREIYGPLGIQTARFNPRESLDEERLVPTEYDGRWRGQLLRGYVHDPTAAIMGGVAGNAGLFSNANDLAILFQMILNEGEYGGEKHLTSKTINLFTKAQNGHRGYGFDKPPETGGYIIGDAASLSSYGHTGFSGTCVWVDPEHDLVYIFLSNRVHPRAQNWELNNLRIRQRIHDVIYEAIAKAEK